MTVQRGGGKLSPNIVCVPGEIYFRKYRNKINKQGWSAEHCFVAGIGNTSSSYDPRVLLKL